MPKKTLSLRQIAKEFHCSYEGVRRNTRIVDKEIRRLNPVYIIPLLKMSISVYGVDKTRELIGKKGMEKLRTYLDAWEEKLTKGVDKNEAKFNEVDSFIKAI